MNNTGKQHFLIFAAGLLMLAVFWWETIRHLTGILWTVDVFAHGLLVPVVSLVMIWSRRAVLAATDVRFSLWGAPILFMSCILWLAGQLLDAALFAHLGLILAIEGLFVLSFGIAMFRALLFPMLFLFLAVPVGYDLVFPLQKMTAGIVIWVLDLIGANFTAEGMIIELPSGLYEVAEACAGVKFLFTSLVTGVLLSNLVFQSWQRRLSIILVSALLPIAANALRVLGILGIAEMTDQGFAKGVDHIVYGWVFLSIVLFALIAIAYRFSDKNTQIPVSEKPIQGGTPVADTPAVEAPEGNIPGAGLAEKASVIGAILLPVLVSLMVPASAERHVANRNDTRGALFDTAPAGYRLLSNPGLIASPYFLNADDSRSALLRRGGTVFHVFTASYNDLRPGSRLFQPGNSLATGNWKEIVGARQGPRSRCSHVLDEKLFRRGNERTMVWPLYLVNGKPVKSGIEEKIHTAVHRLLRQSATGTVLVLSAPVRSDAQDIRQIFLEFLSTFPPDSSLRELGGISEKGVNLCAE